MSWKTFTSVHSDSSVDLLQLETTYRQHFERERIRSKLMVEPAIALPVISRISRSSGEMKGGRAASSEMEGGMNREGEEVEKPLPLATERVSV